MHTFFIALGGQFNLDASDDHVRDLWKKRRHARPPDAGSNIRKLMSTTTYKRRRARQILSQSTGVDDDKEEGSSNRVDGQEQTQDTQDEDFQTQGFVYHESDSEQLWEVEEILEEKRGRFLVKWAGADDNGKPWDSSWVPREDVTDDLVEEWRVKKAKEKKEKERKRKGKAAAKRRTDATCACSIQTYMIFI